MCLGFNRLFAPSEWGRGRLRWKESLMRETQQRFSLITDQILHELRKLIDVPIEDSLEPWCYEATRDNIRHWAHGIGDDNPLWCDPAYASKTQYGRVVAPPSFCLSAKSRSFEWLRRRTGRRTRHIRRASDVTWHKPMLHGDQFTSKAWLKNLIEHQTRFAGRSIQQIYRCEFFNQHDELVACNSDIGIDTRI